MSLVSSISFAEHVSLDCRKIGDDIASAKEYIRQSGNKNLDLIIKECGGQFELLGALYYEETDSNKKKQLYDDAFSAQHAMSTFYKLKRK